MNPNNPELKSFVSVSEDSHFPIQNLPLAVFKTRKMQNYHVGCAIGDSILDLTIVEESGLLKLPEPTFHEANLKPLMRQGKAIWSESRMQISRLLRHDNPTLRDNANLRSKVLVERNDASYKLPTVIGDYTDFYSSEAHARNVGSMFRDKSNPLLPNWKHIPVGYHGRASSVVISGVNFPRPVGQISQAPESLPTLQATQRLDFELELAFFIGKQSELGQPIPLTKTKDHIYGVVLMNDWSARDIQKWEYVPLGPFVSKSFATSISPWVVALEALEPFAIEGPVQKPTPLSYLTKNQSNKGHYNINLEVFLRPKGSNHYTNICQTNTKNLYWSMEQQLAHHTITGCNVAPGDLMASGTISGSESNSFGSMLELTWNGTKPLELSDGQKRTFLQDYDEIKMTGWAEGEGYKVGFGDLTGMATPPKELTA